MPRLVLTGQASRPRSNNRVTPWLSRTRKIDQSTVGNGLICCGAGRFRRHRADAGEPYHEAGALVGRVALDAGASTGGFSQVLLERGARLVLAVDVGHGQLDQRLAGADRLRSFEGVNVRSLDAAGLAELTGDDTVPQLVVADLSFISLTHVLPALRSVATDDADFILLIKPQFEVGRQGVREGIVTDQGLRLDAVERVLWAAHDVGLGTAGVMASPIAGTHGNHEFLAWFRVGAPDPSSSREQLLHLAL